MYFRQILYSLFRTHARSISASQKPLLHRRPRIGLERNNVLARPSYLFAVQSLQVFAIFILPVLKPKDPWLLNPQLTCFERSALFYSFPGLEVIVVRHRRCGGCGISAASMGSIADHHHLCVYGSSLYYHQRCRFSACGSWLTLVQ